jgi:hypothetical protein
VPYATSLVGFYHGDTWNGTQWTDLSPAGNHVVTYKGTISKSSDGINGKAYLFGGTTEGVTFPFLISTTQAWTLIHVARLGLAARVQHLPAPPLAQLPGAAWQQQ